MLQVQILPGLPVFGQNAGFENKEGKVANFIGETRQELNKVTWPSKAELWQSTLVVILTTFIMAAFIGLIDFLLSIVIRIVLG